MMLAPLAQALIQARAVPLAAQRYDSRRAMGLAFNRR
jgi:hypothetical protein